MDDILAQVLMALEPAACFEYCTGYSADPWQRDLFDAVRTSLADPTFETPRQIHLAASRQQGKSESTALAAVWVACYSRLRGRPILILSPSERQSSLLLDKARRHLARISETDPAFQIVGENAISATLRNGSQLVALPGGTDGDTARGFSGAAAVIVDEAARVPTDSLVAVLPSLIVSRGLAVLLSTPDGRSNLFGQLDKDRPTDWKFIRALASQNPRIRPADLENAKRLFGRFRYAQEFELDFEAGSGDSFFHPDDIRAILRPAAEVPPFGGGDMTAPQKKNVVSVVGLTTPAIDIPTFIVRG
jgi:hypothetical protein